MFIRWDDTANAIYTYNYQSALQVGLLTTPLYRDTSAWYHIMVAYDSTQATDTNRVKIYVNGVQLTAFTTDVGATTYPSLNSVGQVGGVSGSVRIGLRDDSFYYFDGYLAEMYFVDGQQLTPSSFGETSTSTGVWIPKKYTGTYGTNGFYLPFTDNSALTTSSNVGLGKDFSGNANYWTTNNISITAGTTYDSMTDVPTLTSATTANYATFNPLLYASSYGYRTLSNGNLTTIGNSGTNNGNDYSTQTIKTGKWYAEFTCTGTTSVYPQVGIISVASAGTGTGQVGYVADSTAYLANGNKKVNGGADASYGNSYTTNDVIGVAVDADNGAIYFSKNGVFQNSGVPTSGSSKTGAASTWTGGSIEFYFSTSVYTSSSGWNANFGQQPFAYTPPTGFVRLNTFNLPTPTIGATASTTANEYFDATTYTGTGSSLSITNSGAMQPDLVWIKIRNQAYDHTLVDAVRGTSKDLESNTTGSEQTRSTVTAFNANGFTVGTDSQVNSNGNTFVAWQWRASNATAVTNTAGTITSTVSANTTAGFSVVTYTGTGSASDTVGHGLGVTPAMVITKRRSSGSGAFNWMVKHSSLASNHNLILESTGASTDVTSGFGSGGIANLSSSTTFGFLNGTSSNPNNANTSGATYVAYCFAQVAGYSAFGSYTGNGSSDGTFIFTGFRPRFVMWKRTDSVNDWYMIDTSRSPYNNATNPLAANLSSDESSLGTNIDFLSNGFKARQTGGHINASGGTYIYMAFAESPFKFALGR
jgi:hypothetical protein